MVALCKIFMFITNIALTIFTGIGIYAFSHSYVWAIIGALVLTGTSLGASPITALIAYPFVEWYFNGSLTVYSAIIIGITLLQLIAAIMVAKFSTDNDI